MIETHITTRYRPLLLHSCDHNQGEILWRSNRLERDIYLVVEGNVQVFLATQAPATEKVDTNVNVASAETPLYYSTDDGGAPVVLEGFQDTHLLNEVRSGGLLSSTLDILAIYTENIVLDGNSSVLTRIDEAPCEDRQFDSEDEEVDLGAGGDATAMKQDDVDDTGETGTTERMRVDAPTTSDSVSFSPRASRPGSAKHSHGGSEGTKQTRASARGSHPRHDRFLPPRTAGSTASSAATNQQTIVARAAIDSTLLIIPEETFRKLTVGEVVSSTPSSFTHLMHIANLNRRPFTVQVKYPHAAAQLVQIILTRFQRVTSLTLYKYLGLSAELIKIEQTVNGFAGLGLPDKLVLNKLNIDRLRDMPKHRLLHSDMENASADSLPASPMAISPTTGTIFRVPSRRALNDHGGFVVGDRIAEDSITDAIRKRKLMKQIAQQTQSDPHAQPASHQQPSRKTSLLPDLLLDMEEHRVLSEGEVHDAVFECVAQSIGIPMNGRPILFFSKFIDTALFFSEY